MESRTFLAFKKILGIVVPLNISGLGMPVTVRPSVQPPADFFTSVRLVAFVAAFLTVLLSLHASPPDSLPILALRVLICTGTFIFLAATVTSFRRSYDRELFHAHRDRMTGMLNKEVLDNRLRQGIRDAAHTGQTLLLVILDLDDFKAVNNRYGHQAGDEVLRTFAKGASSIRRREDLIDRIGGDEFGLLVRVPSIAEGRGFARDIHARPTAVLSEGAALPGNSDQGARGAGALSAGCPSTGRRPAAQSDRGECALLCYR